MGRPPYAIALLGVIFQISYLSAAAARLTTMGSEAVEAKTTKDDKLLLPQWDLAQILDRPVEPETYRIYPVPEPYSEPNKLKKLADNGIPLAPNLSLRIIPINPGDPNTQAGRPIEERDPRYVNRVKTGLGIHLRW